MGKRIRQATMLPDGTVKTVILSDEREAKEAPKPANKAAGRPATK